MSDDRRGRFAAAFYAQASSDWALYKRLADLDDVALCHKLHYLQMACEKLAKAYRLRDLDTDVDAVATKHVGFTKFINAFLRSPRLLEEYADKLAAHKESKRKKPRRCQVACDAKNNCGCTKTGSALGYGRDLWRAREARRRGASAAEERHALKCAAP